MPTYVWTPSGVFSVSILLIPCSTTDIGSSSYEDAHEHSCACAQAAAAQQLLREAAMHWELNAKTLPELVLIYSTLNKWGLTGTAREGYQLHTHQDSSGSQTSTTVNALINRDKSSNWNYYIKRTNKNQMNDDTVGSTVTGIWTPQNLKCINCFLFLTFRTHITMGLINPQYYCLKTTQYPNWF